MKKLFFILSAFCLLPLLCSCKNTVAIPELTSVSAEKTTPAEQSTDTETECQTSAPEAETEVTSAADTPAPAEPEETGYTLCEETRGDNGYYAYEKWHIHAGTDINYKGSGKNSGYVICIDPGHQLHSMTDTEPNSPNSDVMKAKVTGGTTGTFSRIPEHELNLSVALYLRDELVSRGFTVIMIRETADVEISNAERAAIANKYNSTVNIRIHANGSDDETVSGSLGICQTPSNPANGAIFDDCYTLTQYVMNSYCEKTGVKFNQIWKTDTMTGINWSEVPTSIIEMGYMTNRSDDLLMATDQFRRNAAVGIANGIEKFAEAYIPKPNLGIESEVGEAFTECDTIKYVTSPVWMRSEPSLRSDQSKILTLYDGQPVRVVGYNDIWCRVIYGSRICYVSSKYLK